MSSDDVQRSLILSFFSFWGIYLFVCVCGGGGGGAPIFFSKRAIKTLSLDPDQGSDLFDALIIGREKVEK